MPTEAEFRAARFRANNREMYLASESGDLDRATELIKCEPQWSPFDLDRFLSLAAKCGHVAVCRLLLDNGAKIGRAPIYAEAGKLKAVLELFMEYGWNVNDSWRGHVVLP